MTRETKAGLVVSCSFLCLVGLVLFNKLKEQEANGNPDAREMAPVPEEPRPILSGNPTGPAGAGNAIVRAGEPQNAPVGPGVVPIDYREPGASNAILPSKEPAPKEPANVPAPPAKNMNEPAVPAPTAPPLDRFPLINSAQTSAPKAETDSAAAVHDDHAPDHEKKTTGDAHSPFANGPITRPSMGEQGNTPGAATQKETTAPSTPLPHAPQTETKPAVTPTTGDSPVPLPKGSDTSDSAGRDSKPATPLPMPPADAPSSSPSERPALTKTQAVEPSSEPTVSPRRVGGAETSTPSDKSVPTASVPSDRGTGDRSPKLDGWPPAQTQPASPKAPFRLPEAPPAVSESMPASKTPLPSSDMKPTDGGRPDTASPLDSRPGAAEHRPPAGSSGDHRGSGEADFSTRTPAPNPTTSAPPVFPSSDTPTRPGAHSPSPESQAISGSSDELRTRPGNSSVAPSVDRAAPERERLIPTPTTPAAAPMPPTTAGNGMDPGTKPGASPMPLKSTQSMPGQSMPPSGSLSGQASSTRSLPPVGAPAVATSPPVPVSAPLASRQSSSGIPQVESYDESTYLCKPNDTFRLISEQYYHTDQYEHALQLFNRNHPLATNSLRQDPPVLQAGQPVYIPPARILERYYAAPAQDPASSLPAPTPPNRPTTSADTTSFVPRGSTPLVAAGTPVKLPAAPQMPLYRVREGGETMWEISSRTLGSGDRWTDILRLNPRFDPKDLIPAGSQIRLPRDARVDPQDKP